MLIVTTVMSMILVNNYVLAQFLGICPFLGVSKKLDSAVGMGVAVIFVMVLATIATWPIMKLLNSFEIGYLQTVVFILVIAALVQLIEMMMKKYIPSLHKALGVYLPLITTNCAVLGVCISNIDAGYGYVLSIFNAAGAGIGFLLAMVLFAGVRGKLENEDGVPYAFRGVPLTLITAAMLSLGFMGFSGLFQ
ncbi:MAG: electron transport complex protein RnfA [Emergencia timonensis]|uniref:electron transport complex protein RnfA n=1 Tax=Emergencia timonensis TaxID=1776384 RepID=UPI000837960B|nr:RnfABCDGE type electron transport complex subunit A [Emergencia timonensis]WNX89288.1 RnfABCDGE type electron transport complex subunit A [Emergencia timonensis]